MNDDTYSNKELMGYPIGIVCAMALARKPVSCTNIICRYLSLYISLSLYIYIYTHVCVYIYI